MACGSLRAASRDDGGHTHGGGRVSGARLDFKHCHVLLLLFLQCPGLCLRRSIAQPGTVNAVVRSLARKSNGICIPRDRYRWSYRSLDIACPGSTFRLANCIDNSWVIDRSFLVSLRCPTERPSASKNNFPRRRDCKSKTSVPNWLFLFADAGKYVLDCCRQWYAAESEALLES